jgi:hypothetical protein
MSLSEPETGEELIRVLRQIAGFFDWGVPDRNKSQIYNTHVTNISGRYSVEPGPVPVEKAGIRA